MMNDFNFVSWELMNSLSMAMVHSLWQGVFIVLFVLTIIGQEATVKSEVQYKIYLSGLTLLFLCVTCTFGYYYFDPLATSSFHGPVEFATGQITSDLNQTSFTSGFHWQKVVSSAWLIGSLIFFGRLFSSSIHIFNIKRTASMSSPEWQYRLNELQRNSRLGRRIRLFISDVSPVPFVYGVFKPVIIVPAIYFTQLTDRELESILLHELAHIRRHDFITNIFQIIVESLLFFNPAMWWLTKQLKRQREFCCDDNVQMEMPSLRIYLNALYKVALLTNENQPTYSVALFHQKSELIMRVKRMINTPIQKSVSFPFFTMGITTVLLCILFITDVAIGQEQKQIEKPLPAKPQPSDITIPVVEPVDISIIKSDIATAPVIVQPTVVTPVVAVAPIIVKPIVATPVVGVAPVVTSPTPIVSPAVKVTPVAPPVIVEPIEPVIIDTIPESPKMKELTIQMEKKSMELERLAEKLEFQMEQNVEGEMLKLEKLMVEMERRQEATMEKMMRIENSDAMKRIESLSSEIEQLMQKAELNLEKSYPHAEMESLSRDLEKKARTFESEKMSEEDRKKIESEMQILQEKMDHSMNAFQTKIDQFQSNPELKRLQEELEKAHQDLGPMQQIQNEKLNEETRQIQEKMNAIQQSLDQKLKVVDLEMKQKLEKKAQELRQIQAQMEEEARRLKKNE